MQRLAAAALFLVACAGAGDGLHATSAPAPLIGVDGSQDAADRGCHVVLRDLARAGSSFGWETAGSSWVWSGTVEISAAAAAEGLAPSVMYRMAPSGAWATVPAVPSGAPATPGYERFDVRLSEGLPGPGWSGTALARAVIEVVPYLALDEGGRLFDHNRHPRDFDNYELSAPALAVGADATTCAPPAGPARARLVFTADFRHHREGVLAPGGEVTIVYDPARLTQCRHARNGQPLYQITAHLQFAPGGQRRSVSVRDGAPTVDVPSDARGVAVWFENTSAGGCQAWDSSFGANYEFDTLAPPHWLGELRSLITRDADDPCNGGVAAASGFAFDTWARQRAFVTNLCFEVYEPGLTDRDDPALWQKLDARLHYRTLGASAASAWQARAIDLDRRVGNNARYRASWRELDPLRPYHCPEVAPVITAHADGPRAEVRLEYYVAVNGRELRPAPGAAFAGVFVDAAHDPWRAASCAP